ncbi:MAG: hypothetical protein A2W23_04925 [Planctomycetes bacterium RBG_16_43_13]|nr:MAG: hypothetical protein A2W23_04925 [Planctomycetes bacterium RBG_16_43_13]
MLTAEKDITKTAEKGVKHPSVKPPANVRSFKLTFLVVFGVSLLAFIIQKLQPDFTNPLSGEAIVVLVMLALTATVASLFRKQFFSITTSYQFAITVIVTTLFATVLGTFILQNAPPNDYTTNYGESLTGIFKFLYLDDIFHSLWFNGLLVLMTISLLLVLVKRKAFNFKLSQIGFLFTHLGIIIVLIGALIGAMFGEKGFIDLFKGQPSKQMVVMKRGERTDKIKELKFAIKLDDFQVDYYNADYKIYVYKQADAEHYEAVASYPVKGLKETNKIPGTNINFKVVKNNINIPPADKGHSDKPTNHILKIQPDGREITVVVGNTYELKDGWRVEVLNFMPHFSYSIEEKKAVGLSQEPVNPALQVRIFKDGSNNTVWLFAKMPDFAQMHKSGDANAPTLVYVYDSPHSTASTPSLDLEITSQNGTKNVSLQKDPRHPLYLDNGRIVLVLDKKDDDVKDYRSVLSVWNEEKEVKKETIEVNAPLEYDGYLFYQSNYNPKNLNYSGILVVKDPGLWLVWVGFGMLSLGVIYVFYIRPYILKMKQKADLVRN